MTAWLLLLLVLAPVVVAATHRERNDHLPLDKHARRTILKSEREQARFKALRKKKGRT